MALCKLPGLTWDWHRVRRTRDRHAGGFFCPTGGWPTAHAPAMVELPNSDLLCCFSSPVLPLESSRRCTSSAQYFLHLTCSTK